MQIFENYSEYPQREYAISRTMLPLASLAKWQVKILIVFIVSYLS
jgi:hypothetical protein